MQDTPLKKSLIWFVVRLAGNPNCWISFFKTLHSEKLHHFLSQSFPVRFFVISQSESWVALTPSTCKIYATVSAFQSKSHSEMKASNSYGETRYWKSIFFALQGLFRIQNFGCKLTIKNKIRNLLGAVFRKLRV